MALYGATKGGGRTLDFFSVGISPIRSAVAGT